MRVAGDSPVPAHLPGATAFSIGESLVFRGRFFQGRLDEVALFSRALSDAEIDDIYQAAFATPVSTVTSTPRATATPTASAGATTTATASAPTPTVSPSPPPQRCAGDCNDNGSVGPDELVRMVAIALGSGAPSICTAGDANRDGRITINELVRAVNNDLRGCAEAGVGADRTTRVPRARRGAPRHALQEPPVGTIATRDFQRVAAALRGCPASRARRLGVLRTPR